MMLVRIYEKRVEISQRLLEALSTLLVLPDDAWDSPLIRMLGDEIGQG
jgi:hypothetical protein